MIEREGRMRIRRHEFFEDFVAAATRILVELGISQAESELAASALADHVASHWGGQNLNVPMDWRRALTRLELEIYNKFSGDNYDELARHYGISERTVRRYINRIRKRLAEAARRNQRDLFNDEN
ncbi:Mor transcription activator family protein [Vandammella animalimorsus]|uniref:Mor transcription activator family protein n=1 Tax=Vandammella animalimorsus TaxID=2029117 RepID=UPI0031BBBD83